MNAVPEPISSSGELQEMFSMGSNFTGLQRENKEKELEGKIVQWNLEVYEVNQRGDKYRIQFSGDKTVGAFATITPQDAQQKDYIASLQTGAMLTIKGKIDGTTMRNIDLDPAIIVQ